MIFILLCFVLLVVDSCNLCLLDTVVMYLIVFIKELQDAHQQFKANMPAAESEFRSIVDLRNQTKQISDQENPYTSVTIEVCCLNVH